jgi:hypothetical protein
MLAFFALRRALGAVPGLGLALAAAEAAPSANRRARRAFCGFFLACPAVADSAAACPVKVKPKDAVFDFSALIWRCRAFSSSAGWKTGDLEFLPLCGSGRLAAPLALF